MANIKYLDGRFEAAETAIMVKANIALRNANGSGTDALDSADICLAQTFRIDESQYPQERMKILCVLEAMAPEGSVFHTGVLRSIHSMQSRVSLPDGNENVIPLYTGPGARSGLEDRLQGEFGPSRKPFMTKGREQVQALAHS